MAIDLQEITALGRHAVPVPEGVVNAQRCVLPLDLSIEQGLQRIVGNCLVHIQGNVPGVVHGGDRESVHQMRIGLRRLRLALEIFDEVKACPPHIQTELAWLSDQLGCARDWDVFCALTLPAVGVDVPGFDQLQRHAQQVARRIDQRAAAAVHSARCAKLWLLLTRWLDAGDCSGTGQVSAPLIHFAARMVLHRQRALRAHCVDVQTGDQHSRHRHRLRIVAKKLRYVTEFFLSYYPAKPARRFVARLAALQDVFGESNDIAVADRLLRELAQQYPGVSEGSAYARGYLAALAVSQGGQLRQCARRFAKLKKLRPHVARD